MLQERIGERITLAGLVLALTIQVGASIWWASNITAVQDQHTIWIATHSKQQENYPSLVTRIEALEKSMGRLVDKLEDLISLMHERYSTIHEQ